MTAASTSSRAPPSRCASCGGVLVDALVLVCGHDLCLRCAGAALRDTTSLKGNVVACGTCRERTQLCDEAMSTLLTQVDAPHMESCNSGFGLGRRQGSSTATPMSSSPSPLGASLSVNGGGAEGGNQQSWPSSPAPPSTTEQFNSSRAVGSSASLRRSIGHVPTVGRCPQVQQQQVQQQEAHPARARGSIPVDAFLAGNWPGRLAHIPRCPEHPDEQATYFCATCECFCICAECVVQRDGRHHDHEVLRVNLAHEKLRAGAGALMDEAVALEDELEKVADGLMWQRKDVERAASRGRATIRQAFERARAQLNDREARLMEALDTYEGNSLSQLDSGLNLHGDRLDELRRLQENLRTRCGEGSDAVEALNTYASAKKAITSLSLTFRGNEVVLTEQPHEFAALINTARVELDRHADGLASLEETVQGLCKRGLDLPPGIMVGQAGGGVNLGSRQSCLSAARTGSTASQSYDPA
mmetsp:Transcript_74124/g.162233  ORF Transcript_74124/g.162233 Transcript_74124/m.162233 type:complete len:472 (-) Transcript_74124:4-1419(-)